MAHGENSQGIIKLFLRNLNLSDNNVSLVKALESSSLSLLIMINRYLENYKIDSNDEQVIIKKAIETTQKDVFLAWPLIPISEYIQKTTEEQPLISFRTGCAKSFRFTLVSALQIQLRNNEKLDSQQKVTILQSCLLKMQDDPIWESGKDGRKAIANCLDNFKHVETILNKEFELYLLELICYSVSVIANYRQSVNNQYGLFGFGRQGQTNLNQLEAFINDANKLVKQKDINCIDKAKNMLTALANRKQGLSGGNSDKAWQDIFTILDKTYNKFISVKPKNAETITENTSTDTIEKKLH